MHVIIESLCATIMETPRGHRKLRATGAAVAAAIALVSTLSNFSGRIMCFISGACTYGPGAIVPIQKKHILRQKKEILEGKHKKAKKVSQIKIIFYLLCSN